jgi:hypothetical protein
VVAASWTNRKRGRGLLRHPVGMRMKPVVLRVLSVCGLACGPSKTRLLRGARHPDPDAFRPANSHSGTVMSPMRYLRATQVPTSHGGSDR